MLHVNKITPHSHSIISMVLMKSLRSGELEDIFVILNVSFSHTRRRKNQFSFSGCNLAWNIIFVSWTYTMQCSFVCTLSSHNFWNMPPVVQSRHHPQMAIQLSSAVNSYDHSTSNQPQECKNLDHDSSLMRECAHVRGECATVKCSLQGFSRSHGINRRAGNAAKQR